MRLFFCSTDVGCFEFLFCEDQEEAIQLFAIYMVLAKVHPSKLWVSKIAPHMVVPSRRIHLCEALSRGVKGFASYDGQGHWLIRSTQETFDALSDGEEVGEA